MIRRNYVSVCVCVWQSVIAAQCRASRAMRKASAVSVAWKTKVHVRVISLVMRGEYVERGQWSVIASSRSFDH